MPEKGRLKYWTYMLFMRNKTAKKRKCRSCFIPSCGVSFHNKPWRRYARMPNSLKYRYCEAFGVTVKRKIYVCDKHYTADDINWSRSFYNAPYHLFLREGTVLTRCTPLTMAMRQRVLFYIYDVDIENEDSESSSSDDPDDCPWAEYFDDDSGWEDD